MLRLENIVLVIVNAIFTVILYKLIGFEMTVLWLGIMIRWDLTDIKNKVNNGRH